MKSRLEGTKEGSRETVPVVQAGEDSSSGKWREVMDSGYALELKPTGLADG